MRQISEVLGEIKASNLPAGTLAKLEHNAKALSIFASTSIEGNPLPLTDVKRILKKQPVNLRDTEREIINYNNALEYVYRKVRSGSFTLSVNEFEKIRLSRLLGV